MAYVSVSWTCVCVQFESDLQKLRIERLRNSKLVEDYMECFERKRTQDIKVGVHERMHWHLYVGLTIISNGRHHKNPTKLTAYIYIYVGEQVITHACMPL